MHSVACIYCLRRAPHPPHSVALVALRVASLNIVMNLSELVHKLNRGSGRQARLHITPDGGACKQRQHAVHPLLPPRNIIGMSRRPSPAQMVAHHVIQRKATLVDDRLKLGINPCRQFINGFKSDRTATHNLDLKPISSHQRHPDQRLNFSRLYEGSYSFPSQFNQSVEYIYKLLAAVSKYDFMPHI
ncbi:hypothetical protein GBAR_LOCUS884 [Geodia barretti]|uniref:Uncharacterized protein n=1 Tax=Geodia barretti TaxID=519541 RepID=A0AA35QTY0_GEOBA|nr:hypothetical protein GBAR_LOCUS884 [Geodia barretti]